MSQATEPRRDAAEQPPVQKGYLFEILVIGFSVFFWFLVMFQIAFVVPRIVKEFNDFRMRLPMATQLVVDHIWWMAPVVMFCTFLLCVLIRSRWGWLILLIGVPLLLNLTIFLNLMGPLLKLLEGLRGNA